MVLNWLITGGCGFIGVNLIESLLRDPNNRVRILDNLSVGGRESLAAVASFSEYDSAATDPSTSCPAFPPVQAQRESEHKTETNASRVQLIVGDILDRQATLRVAEGMDVIVHLAANTGVAPSVENPRLDCNINVVGTLNMLEAARRSDVKRFVFASSGAPLGEVEPPIHEELAPHPVSPYGASKLAGEGYCSAYYRTFGVETVALRFGNVYGPRSNHKSSVVARFIKQAISGETLEIYGDGDQTRDFIYIEDLVRAIKLSVSRQGIGGEAFQIATSRETTVRDLVALLFPILADAGIKTPEIRHCSPRLGDVRRNYSDTGKAQEMLGWRAETSLSDGLTRTVKSLLGQKYA